VRRNMLESLGKLNMRYLVHFTVANILFYVRLP